MPAKFESTASAIPEFTGGGGSLAAEQFSGSVGE